MGVKGLWKLLEPCGCAVPTDALQDQTVGVDVSIWLNQAMKGYRDSRGQPVANAHLLCVFSRVCKLLTYRVRPVFVFDGAAPSLKVDTLAVRRLKKRSAAGGADRASSSIVKNLLKQEALRAVMGDKAPLPHSTVNSATIATDMFQLPDACGDLNGACDDDGNESSDNEADFILNRSDANMYNFDFDSKTFHSLPFQVKHDILSELKDTRKQNSWGKMSEMPEQSGEFSNFQMERLLKRKKFQDTMYNVESEITQRNNEMLHLGIDLSETISVRKMASKADTYLVLSKVKSDADVVARRMSESATCHEDEVEDKDLDTAASIGEYLAGSDLQTIKSTSDSNCFFSKHLSFRKTPEKSTAWSNRRDCVSSSGISSDPLLNYPPVPVLINTKKVEARNCHTMHSLYSNSPLKFSEPLLSKELRSSDDFSSSCSMKIPSVSDAKKEGDEQVLSRRLDCEERKSFCVTGSKSLSIQPDGSNSAMTVLGNGGNTSDDGGLEGRRERGSAEGSSSAAGLVITIDPLKIVAQDDMFVDVFMSDESEDEESNVDGSKQSENNEGESELASSMVPVENYTSISASDSESSIAFVGSNRVDIEKKFEQNVLRIGCKSESTDRRCGQILESQIHRGECFNSDQIQSSTCPPTSVEVSGHDVRRQSPSPRVSVNSTPVFEKENDNTEKSEFLLDETMNFEDPCDDGLLGEDDIPKSGPDTAAHNDNQSLHQNVTCNASKIPRFLNQPENHERVSSEVVQSVATVGSVVHSSPMADIQMTLRMTNPAAIVTGEFPSSPPRDPSSLLPDSGWDATELSTSCAGLEDLASRVSSDQLQLLKERGRQERLAASVTQQMYSDIQLLLQLFGVPYVVAPCEAEAQCAFLETAGLTSATITDDSDIWLFGGRTVYKNFFNQNKYVERYRAGDIETALGLSRREMISLAMLSGSDYTAGVDGVGCVRAMEILAEFTEQETSSAASDSNSVRALAIFRQWWLRVRDGVETTNTPLKRTLASLRLPDWFPSTAVAEAYFQPTIDNNREPFSWAQPDWDGLRHLASSKLGWSGSHTDSVLQPVISRLESNGSQTRLTQFFSSATTETSGNQPRLCRALRRLRDGEDAVRDDLSSSKKTKRRAGEQTRDVVFKEEDDDLEFSAIMAELDQHKSVVGNDERALCEANGEQCLTDQNMLQRRGQQPVKSRGLKPKVVRRSKKAADLAPKPMVRDVQEGFSNTVIKADDATVDSLLGKLSSEQLCKVQQTRRLRARAQRIKCEMRVNEEPSSIGSSATAARAPSTRKVRERMYRQLVRDNPRLRAERISRLRAESMDSASTQERSQESVSREN